MHKRKIKVNPMDQALQILIYLIIIALCLIILLPCLNVVALAFNDGADAARGGVWFWPRQFTMDNFKEVFKDGSITTAYVITIARTVIGTFLSLMVTTLAGYALKQEDLPGRKILTMLITFTMLFGGGMIPTYLVLKSLHLTNTIWVVILFPALNVYNLVLMRNFFEGIPASLFESATLDGCTPMQTFIRIVLPMSKAALASIGLMFAVTYWNDYTHYKLYITDSNLYNFQMKLRSIIMGSDLPQANGGATENTVKNAAIIVIIIPFMIVYPFLQKYFVKGVNIGAVKE